ncbi:DNA replication/repair protein RecF [Ilumatobacter nonamiensis]|uniref:DNA replication/repair protein RecF n=1 Tax=Ilumatobacter nonamiensis TaxID=467093 RepID=UPI00034B34F6|nr:DNA replication/repair protein RecF [Ilumatobacter nonamiensis]
MIVSRLELIDFRNYSEASFDLTEGTTVVLGDNGQGKTNLAEALAYLATLTSFRGAPGDALVRVGTDQGIIRATVRHDDGRESLIEAELRAVGRNRVQVNRQKLQRVRDLLGTVRVTVFSPDDLIIVKGGPGERRRFMDDTLVTLATKYDAIRLEMDRIVKQRNTLLKQAQKAGHRELPTDIEVTLDVWDAKFSEIADQFGYARATLVSRIAPMVQEAYEHLAGVASPIELRYEPEWRRTGLKAALTAARGDDVRRGVSTVGPHRDELDVTINGLPGRTHASQGEQRTLALALRLAGHRLATERIGSAPVLVLDDVLSELDDGRARALLGHLPDGQVVITTASELPPAARADRIIRIAAGTIVPGD